MNCNYYLGDTGELLDIKGWKEWQSKCEIKNRCKHNDHSLNESIKHNVGNIGKNILVHKIADNYTLIINSFRNCVMLLNDETLNLLSSNVNALSSEEKVFFAENLRTDLGWLQKKKSEDESQNHLSNWAICLSYACNMQCTYCFQQHDKALDKKQITEEKLNDILSFIKKEIANEKINGNNEFKGSIELFGGEPLLLCNSKLVNKAFKFC